MAAYVIIGMTITDRAAQAEYREPFPEVLAAYGGRVMRPGPATRTRPRPSRRPGVRDCQAGDGLASATERHPRAGRGAALRDRLGTVNRVYVVSGDDIR